MRVTYRTALEIATHEALVRQAYKDSVGVWTWSVGVTSASGHNVERYIGKPQPLQHCLEVYVWLLEKKYAPAVRKAFAGHELTEEQFAAALSFHWNTGSIGTASWVKEWKAGRIAEARRKFMLWNKPASIIERRENEAFLFFDGIWAHTGTILEIERVKANYQPDWKSAKRIDISRELQAALGAPLPEPIPLDPVPPPAPLEPVPPEPVAPGINTVTIATLIAGVIAAVLALATALGFTPEQVKGLIP